MNPAIADFILLFSAALTGLIACSCLALSQDRHWQSATDAESSKSSARRLRWIGRIFFVGSVVFCILRDGLSFALLFWPLLTSASALAIGLLLTYKPRLLLPISLIATTGRPGHSD